MLDLSLYPMIYKRKSFHLFRNLPKASISDSEIREIHAAYERFEPLMPGIRTAIRIVHAEETSCARGQEYCILLYIFMCFLNICLENERVSYNIQLHVDPCEDAERTLVAEYTLDLGGNT